MAKVVGIVFKDVGKIYWFNPSTYTLKKDDKVIVETIRGTELGTVMIPPRMIDDSALEHELKPIIRIANKNDLKSFTFNQEKADKDFDRCLKIVKKNKLDMKLLYCEYTLDRQKIIIYYTAEGRVDFRELLKDLAAELKVRIELRQIGPREGAKVIGGLGVCGREICCKSSLREFDLVTMKMAKDQNMSLSATKIAGLCGKLMCCIGYENEVYQEIRSRIPLTGDIVDTPTKKGCKVISEDILRERIRTIDNEENIEEWDAKDCKKVKSHKETVSDEDLSDDIKDE